MLNAVKSELADVSSLINSPSSELLILLRWYIVRFTAMPTQTPPPLQQYNAANYNLCMDNASKPTKWNYKVLGWKVCN